MPSMITASAQTDVPVAIPTFAFLLNPEFRAEDSELCVAIVAAEADVAFDDRADTIVVDVDLIIDEAFDSDDVAVDAV